MRYDVDKNFFPISVARAGDSDHIGFDRNQDEDIEIRPNQIVLNEKEKIKDESTKIRIIKNK